MNKFTVSIFAGLLAVLLSPVSYADERVTECDLLAAHPEDPDRIVDGVSSSGMDQGDAIAACEAAVAADPENLRLRYQLSRALFYNGQNERAIPIMADVAEKGYRQAQFVMGAFINNGRQGAPTDICEAERLWYLSAKAGREAAQVSYVHHVTKGLFDGCELHANDADLSEFMAEAKDGARNYYLRVLLGDLEEDLAGYRAKGD